MKNLNLLLITLIFSSLLIGCGMKGPLYREAPVKPKVTETQKNQVTNTQDSDNVTDEVTTTE